MSVASAPGFIGARRPRWPAGQAALSFREAPAQGAPSRRGRRYSSAGCIYGFSGPRTASPDKRAAGRGRTGRGPLLQPRTDRTRPRVTRDEGRRGGADIVRLGVSMALRLALVSPAAFGGGSCASAGDSWRGALHTVQSEDAEGFPMRREWP